MHLFLASGSLEVVAMDILRPLHMMLNGKQCILRLTYCYSMLTWPLLPFYAAVWEIELHSLDLWTKPFDIAMHMLTDDGQSSSVSFSRQCSFSGKKLYMTTAYQVLANGQPERFNKKIIARLRHYVEGLQPESEIIVQALNYLVSFRAARFSKWNPFSMLLSQFPAGHTEFDAQSAIRHDTTGTTSLHTLRSRLVQLVPIIRQTADKQMKTG